MPKAPTGRDFYVATPEEIRDGRTTDVYFLRTLDILKKAGKDRTRVVAEVTAGTLPNGWPWGILCGVEEAVHLLKGRPVSLWCLPEGSLCPARTARGIPVPVMILEGAYGDWAVYETPVLGLICQASGIATKASRLRKLAAGKQLLSFGVRRMHPGIAPLIERSAYVAGADATTTPLGAELFGAPAMGTMPHALVIVMGGPREAFAAVHKFLEEKVPRIALVDTYYDEKTEALLAVEAIPALTGVRLDTPASRRGNFPAIVREVRWELDLRGRGADVRGGRLEGGPRLRPVSGQRSGLDAAPVARGHPAADGRRNLPCGPRNLTEPFIEPHRFVGATMDRSKASVRATYGRIAASYAAARERPWDEVLDFITDLPAGSQVLDVGCGHGRHARPLALTGQSVVGIDLSRKLLSIGKKATSSSQDFRSIEWVGADATALPFPDATFDAALSIAVLHHLLSRADRLLAVTEMRRVLRPGAKAFLSVWSVDDPYLEGVLGGRPKKPDVEIPWRLPDGTTVPRPYHLFKDDELERLIIESGLEGESFFRGAGNRFVLARANG